MRATVPTILFSLALGHFEEAHAQVASAFPPSTSPSAYPEESGPGPTFQLAMSYSFPKYTLAVGGNRTLTKPADLESYEDEKPVSGTFKGGSSLSIRTVASVLFGQRENNFSLGFGLESLEMGMKEKLSKGPSQASFDMNSFILEGGVQRNMSRWGQTSLRISLAQGLSGKLQTRYLGYATYSDSPLPYITIDDMVKTGSRLGITGQYLLHLAPAFAMGLHSSAEYGVVSLEDRNAKSVIYGYHWGLTILLRL